MADGVVQVAPDSGGKKVDTSELTRADGTVVERQRVVLGDNLNPNYATVDVGGQLYVRAEDLLSVFQLMLIELRRIRKVLWSMSDSAVSDGEDELDE